MAKQITSLQNPRIKQAVKLRESRQRGKTGRTLIDGAREIGIAAEAGVELVEVFACPAFGESHVFRPTLRMLAHRGVEPTEVAPAVFEKIVYGERAEGLLAVAATPHRDLGDLKLPDEALVVVLEGVEKPGNVGAVIRTADAAGAAAVVVADAGTDLFNPNTIRASLGTIFTVPVCAADAVSVRDWLYARRLRIFASRVDAQCDYIEADLTGGCAIVMGNESRGLSNVWTDPKIEAIRLPMHGRVDSLNVSATAAVLLYEALRQRRGSGG